MRAFLLTLVLCGAATLHAQNVSRDKPYPTFAIRPTGIHASIEKGLVVTVKSVVEGSPAASTKLQAGDVLVSAGGRSLAGDDPRVRHCSGHEAHQEPVEAHGIAAAGTGQDD
ncbi:MAG: PDZ domain-containing protein [Roseibacillus sp.]